VTPTGQRVTPKNEGTAVFSESLDFAGEISHKRTAERGSDFVNFMARYAKFIATYEAN
jgi:hypothetical protein